MEKKCSLPTPTYFIKQQNEKVILNSDKPAIRCGIGGQPKGI